MAVSPREKTSFQERRNQDRRKLIRRAADRNLAEAQNERLRKLHSLLELGHIFGLDLRLSEMLLKIAQKATEVMEADRCSLFLYDPGTNQLWSTVALGMGERVIRFRAGMGLAGYCFKTGEVVNIEDAYTDFRFNKEVDLSTGYRTRSILCMPLYRRDGGIFGVIQVLNKQKEAFTKEDETFLRTFGNHAAVFIEMAQLQQARIETLEQSRAEWERLNKVKSKALDHLSHELRTPLAVIQGNLRILRRKLQAKGPASGEDRMFETMERHLNRIIDIQQETDKMIRSHQEFHMEDLRLFPIVQQVLERARQKASHRSLQFALEGPRGLSVLTNQTVLEDTVAGLLKNAIENTPDDGLVRISMEQRNGDVLLAVQDFGIGITEENQKSIFDGLFHTQETDLYESKKPYDFCAGGKGLDLLRIKTYGKRFGFDLQLKSRRCRHLPGDRDLCPGKISLCSNCSGVEDCMASGGSTFSLVFLREERSGIERVQL